MVAVRRLDALASLRRPDLRHRDDDVDLQRAVVDGSVGLASEHRADARSACARRRRTDRRRRSVASNAAQGDRGVRAEHPKEIEITRFRGHYYATRERAASCRSTSRSSAPRDQLPADLVVGAAERGHGRRADRRRQLARRLRRLLLRSRSRAVAAGAARALRRSAADLAVFRSEARHDRAQGRTADAAQSLAVSRLPQPRLSVSLLPASALGHRRDRAEHRRDRVERDDADARRGGGCKRNVTSGSRS